MPIIRYLSASSAIFFLIATFLVDALEVTSPLAGQIWDIASLNTPKTVTWTYNSTDATNAMNVSLTFNSPGWGEPVLVLSPGSDDLLVPYPIAANTVTLNSSWFDSVIDTMLDLSYFNNLWTVEVSNFDVKTSFNDSYIGASHYFSIIDSRNPAWSHPSGPMPELDVLSIATFDAPASHSVQRLGVAIGVCLLLTGLGIATCCVWQRRSFKRRGKYNDVPCVMAFTDLRSQQRYLLDQTIRL